MSTTILKHFALNLQLFADGGDGGEGGNAPGVSTQNVSDSATANSQTAPDKVPQESREQVFERLIKTDYKDLYSKNVENIVQSRLKSTKETVEKYNQLKGTLEILANKYGVKPDDIKGLTSAIENDESYYEDEAFELGISVEQLKEIKKLRRDNEDLKQKLNKQNEDAETNRIYSAWLEQEQKAKAKYPSLNLKNEIANPQFASLLQAGIDVETAYTVVHKDEIIPAAMQYTAKTVEQNIARTIATNGMRPSENGINSSSPSVTKIDVNKMTKAQREEFIRRARNGERITF